MVVYKIREKMSNKADKDHPEKTADVFMDPNTWAIEASLETDNMSWSKSGNTLIYSVTKKGSDWQQIYVRDTETMKDYSDELSWVKFGSYDFTAGEKGFFYNRYPAPQSLANKKNGQFDDTAGQKTEELANQKIYYHRIGTKQDQDVLIYEDKENPDLMFDPMVSFDEKYLLVQISKDTNPVNLVKFAEISNEKFDKKINLKPLISNWVGKFTFIYNIDTKFYFLTNYKAPKGRIVMIDLKYYDHRDPSLSLFEVIPQHPTYILKRAHCSGRKLVT